ncbi:hypothetical protein J2X53_004160 [Pseudorhodobacter sp. 4114]|nr:hypothetical protein [Pseudorhodobacter sp. 4114]
MGLRGICFTTADLVAKCTKTGSCDGQLARFADRQDQYVRQ